MKLRRRRVVGTTAGFAAAVTAVVLLPLSCDSPLQAKTTAASVTASCNDGSVEIVYSIPPGDQQVALDLAGQPLTEFNEPASAAQRTLVTGVPDMPGMRFDMLLGGQQAVTIRLPRC